MITAGLDIGGTAIKIGLINADGTVISKTAMGFDRGESFEKLVDSV